MKKSLLAIAALVACLESASAQSSVTIYGTIDVNLKAVKNDGSARRLSETQDGLNRSGLGFRGVEDLGGGLKASFTLETSVGIDVGGIGTGTGRNKFWDRNSIVSLSGGFGELRLGRDYVPTFWNNVIFDPLGGIPSVGGSLNLSRNVGGLAVPGGVGSVAPVNTFSRADNSIGYFLPRNLGGLYGQVMAAAAEEGPPLGNLGRYLGARLGYAAGSANIAVAYGQTRASLPRKPKYVAWNVGGVYNFSFLKLMGLYSDERNEVPVIAVRERRFTVGVAVPFGASEVHASFGRSVGSPGPAAVQYALGYVYNLSKRTALYTTVGILDNKGDSVTGGTFSVAPGPSAGSFPTPGGTSRGADFGIRHFF